MAKKKQSDCPLHLASNGQWAKTVRGKRRQFGTDKDVALKRWADEKDFRGRWQRSSRYDLAIDRESWKG